MKFSGLMAIACAAALTAACSGDAVDDNRSVTETEQVEPDDRVGTTGAADRETGSPGVSGEARDFVEKAAHGGMAEVQLGQLASERAQSAEVKQFGQMMVRDHTRANDELKAAVAAYNVPIPTGLDEKHTDLMNKLRDLRGAEFDREYMDAMVDGHQDMQGLLDGRADDGRNDPQNHAQTNPADATDARDGLDAALNQWALKTKPSVDQHLKTAQQIQDKLQNTNDRNSTN